MMKSETANIDLSDEDFAYNSIYTLAGKWEFYWDTLLTPSQIDNCNIKPQLVEVPGAWIDYGKNCNGSATYRIKLKVKPNKYYALSLKRVYLSHKLWVNNKPFEEVGKISNNPDELVPCDLPQEYVFFVDTDYVDIVLQLAANENYKTSGIDRYVRFGSAEAIARNVSNGLIYEIFIIGAMFLAFMFIMLTLLFNKLRLEDNFFFALFLVFQILSVLVDGEMILTRIFPEIPWIVESKLWYISVWLRSLFLLFYISNITEKYLKKIVQIILVFASVFMVNMVMISPIELYAPLILLFAAWGFLTTLYSIFIVLKSIPKDKSFIYSLVGLILIIVLGTNDLLLDFSYFEGIYLNGFGVFVYIVFELIHLSTSNINLSTTNIKLVHSIEKQEGLNEKLSSINTFDIKKSLETYMKVSYVDRILIFDKKENDLFLKHKINKNLEYDDTKQKVDFNENNTEFCAEYLKNVFEKHEIINQNFKSKTNNKYLLESNLKNLFIIPIINDKELMAIIYIEKLNEALTEYQKTVVVAANNFLQNIIHSSYLYSNLFEINKDLEIQVEAKKEKIKYQHQKIDLKNQELNDKIQFIEEQVVIHQNMTDEIANQNEKLNGQYEKLAAQNKELKADRESVKTIQNSLIRNLHYVRSLVNFVKVVADETPFEASFYFDKPKLVVGGDFLWSKQLDDKFLFTLVDSTGHGIPGALMSMVGTKILNDILFYNIKKNINFNAADFLEAFRKQVKKDLTAKDSKVQDGYDAGFCIYYHKTQKLEVACANNPVLIVRNKEIIHIKPDRMPIGAYIKETPFMNVQVQLQKGDTIYLFSDGYVDQFGEKTNTKFYLNNFKKLLIKISEKTTDEQLTILKQTFAEWKGNTPQFDDVSVACFKL